jgi:hypothetical protein
VSFIDECFGVVDFRLGFLLVETEAERVGGFLVGVLAEDEVLAPNSVIFCVVVEPASVRQLVASSVGDGVVDGECAASSFDDNMLAQERRSSNGRTLNFRCVP